MVAPTRALIIINKTAARARRAWPLIQATLAESGVQYDTCEPAHAGDTEKETRARLRAGYHTVAIVGGDGTLSEAASGFFESCEESSNGMPPRAINERAALAVLPAGTGDDFARGLAGKREPLEKWLWRFIAHCRKEKMDDESKNATISAVDLLYAMSDDGARRFICLNAATLGIGAEVAVRVAAQGRALRRLSGEARFALAAVAALAAWRERRVCVRVDGGEMIECATNLIAIVNGPFSGGGMNFSPTAETTDGQLDVVTACGVSRVGILRELTRIHRGGHLANPKVRVVRGARVRVEAINPRHDALGVEADGDVRGATPIEFCVMPRALRVIL
ncbi:MAG TPA: diacylglycerol kinase family protein [Pyrinomonadaceae bacterium]|nr:diacylglycerol kinase family protein [Pyrinomonadaceae bacterium]